MSDYRCLICGGPSEEFGPYRREHLLCRQCALERPKRWWETPAFGVFLMVASWALVFGFAAAITEYVIRSW